MIKLVILIDPIQEQQQFEQSWPAFLRLAEEMPGLRRETTSWVGGNIYGETHPAMIHELYFDSQVDLQAAMESPQGQAAGRMLQRLTGGKMSLFFAHHQEDNLENIRAHQPHTPKPEKNADHH
jgi:uncharacterized protein (TIGR02118 family)